MILCWPRYGYTHPQINMDAPTSWESPLRYASPCHQPKVLWVVVVAFHGGPSSREPRPHQHPWEWSPLELCCLRLHGLGAAALPSAAGRGKPLFTMFASHWKTFPSTISPEVKSGPVLTFYKAGIHHLLWWLCKVPVQLG